MPSHIAQNSNPVAERSGGLTPPLHIGRLRQAGRVQPARVLCGSPLHCAQRGCPKLCQFPDLVLPAEKRAAAQMLRLKETAQRQPPKQRGVQRVLQRPRFQVRIREWRERAGFGVSGRTDVEKSRARQPGSLQAPPHPRGRQTKSICSNVSPKSGRDARRKAFLSPISGADSPSPPAGTYSTYRTTLAAGLLQECNVSFVRDLPHILFRHRDGRTEQDAVLPELLHRVPQLVVDARAPSQIRGRAVPLQAQDRHEVSVPVEKSRTVSASNSVPFVKTGEDDI